jgi:hypothetical protein
LRFDQRKPNPEIGEDLADVVATATEHGEEGIADGSLQGTSGEATVGFHVADLCLDGAAAAEVSDQLRRRAAAGAADQATGPVLTVAALAAVDDDEVGALVGQDRHLFQYLPQSVAVIGIARKAAHADDEALVQRGGDADLAAELVADPRLTLGDAVDFGLMQGIDLVRAIGGLVKQLRHEAELPDDAIPQVAFGMSCRWRRRSRMTRPV